MTKNLKAIQVGLGGFGRSWFQLLLESEEVTLVAVVDQVEDNLRLAREQRGESIKTYTRMDQALEQVEADFVLLVTPPTTHATLAKLALKKGLHVMMEKPLTNTIEDGRDLLCFSKSYPQKVMVSQNYRWNPQIQTIKALLAEGTVGSIEYGDYYFNRATRFGGWRDDYEEILLQDMAIHHFDILRYLLEKEAVSVTGESFQPSWSWFKGKPHANAQVVFEGNIRVSYMGRWAGKGRKTPWNGEFRLIGEKGAIELIDDRVYFYREEEDEPKEIPLITSAMPDRLISLSSFVQSILENKTPPTSIEDNLNSLELTAAVIEAAKTGEKIILHQFRSSR